jgi:ketosteroid isomerase-like protein
MKQILLTTLSVVGAAAIVLSQVGGKMNDQTNKAEPQLRELNRQWDEASMGRDTAVLARILADDYVYTDARGAVITKSAYLMSLIKAPDMTQQSFTSDDLGIRVYGDVAVVTGRSSWKGRSRGKSQFADAQYRFTDVLVKRNGRWQAVATQATAIAQ